MNVPRRALLLIVLMTVAQLPVALRQLLVVLLGHQNTGSFATAGVASAGCGIGLALTAPLAGRLLGRLGARPVLLATGLAHLLALLGLAVTTEPVAFVALATAAGLSTPPAVGSGRSHLARIVPTPVLSRAYAVNAVGQEVLYVGGPLAVTLSLLISGPTAALVAFAVIGTAGLVGMAAVLPPREVDRRPAERRSALPGRATRRTIVGTHLGYMTGIGAMWVLVPAFATTVGHPDQAGLLVTIWSVGSLAGGLLLARRGRPGTPGGAYLTLVGMLAATSLALLLPRSVPQMAVALALFGLALAPFLAVTDEILARSTPAPHLAETYGWLQTAGQVGIAVGSATSGVVNDHLGNTPAFLVVSAALALALVVALSRRGTLRLPSAPPPAETVATAVSAGGRGFVNGDAG
ncbi:MFS transporter [Micromonospora sp. CV4]|uniref:MFS transporter n=1 Tax=Micromonospora sp. CV4 TaxID=2478711 RepID=UPI000EF5431E|nr:MFS transporter [Micromonospora sp. CV4]RLP95661.1 MFS transporter [Micromonospora sp. CV4]